MTDNHPIIPPPELVQQWDEECDSGYNPEINNTFDALKCFASKAAQWGSDQELEACCEWLDYNYPSVNCRTLRAARRPKLPSLKEQALAKLAAMERLWEATGNTPSDIVRRALEQLDD